MPFSVAGTIQTNSIVLGPALSLALHRSPFLRISQILVCSRGIDAFTGRLVHGAELRSSCPANRCSGRGGSLDRARDQRRLKARAMCSVRNEASSEWRANLRMRFIKRKSLETGQKSASTKCAGPARCSRSDLLEPRFCNAISRLTSV
jgi:hypothetical protein